MAEEICGSSPKRRKISTRATVNISQRLQARTVMIWPPHRVPVEIFVDIIKHLPRPEVQAMRLVNREFEAKVSTYLFRTVVVPFRPEIYGISDGQSKDTKSLNVTMRDKGMQVFKGFGSHILRFAMSFEIDYSLLHLPPSKSDQELVTAFWGMYRWPFQDYTRFKSLEGLEETADETRTMAKALRFITNAEELALSIDGGLGWLSGPDVNIHDDHPSYPPSVFGDSRFPAKTSQPQSTAGATTEFQMTAQAHTHWPGQASPAASEADSQRLVDLDPAFVQILGHMLGVVGNGGAMGQQLSRPMDPDMQVSGTFQNPDAEGHLSGVPELLNSNPGGSTVNSQTILTSLFDEALAQRSDPIEGLRSAQEATLRELPLRRYMDHNAVYFHSEPSFKTLTEAIHTFPLKPNNLKSSQKETLLEIEWAQRAFIQSWTIAVTDNPDSFRHITRLNIARLPSHQVRVLKSENFWLSFKNLKSVSLGVIPSWREMSKPPSGWIEDILLKPSAAIEGVYDLLRNHVSPLKNIKELSFEWLCGGEEDSGIFARNKLMLPAPLVPMAGNMLLRKGAHPAILVLPHVESLVLKNCWSSPHILRSFVCGLKKKSLKKITLVSVSLSAPIPINSNPQPSHSHSHNHNVHVATGQQTVAAHVEHMANHQAFAQIHNIPHMAQGLAAQFYANGHIVQAYPDEPPYLAGIPWTPAQPSAEEPFTARSWDDPPPLDTWAHVIETTTPGQTLAEARHDPDTDDALPPRKTTSLRTMIFRSCGYVTLPIELDQGMLDGPTAGVADTQAFTRRKSDLEVHMLKCMDYLLGTIVNHMDPREATTLNLGWGLEQDWDTVTKNRLRAASLADGIHHPGRGRFRGCISTDMRETMAFNDSSN